MSLEARVARTMGSLQLDVDLCVGDGEVLALLGPNGAGKTTLLRVLAGLAGVDVGRIAIDGTVVDDPLAGRFVPAEHRSVGMVFQDYLLFDHLRVIDNVAFGICARGASRAGGRAEARRWLERVGLAERADARPPQLSGGQAQRVALARALATSPRLMLLDEPLAALDAAGRAELRHDLRTHLGEFGGSTVLVTHDPVDAFAIADRVAVLEGGRVTQTGSLDAVAAQPRSRYVAELVGVNLLRGEGRGGVVRTTADVAVVAADAPDGAVYAVIHPHAVSLTRSAPSGSSVRNVWPVTVAEVGRLGGRARVRVAGPVPLVAEVTAAALAELDLRPGDEVFAGVKATEVQVYPA